MQQPILPVTVPDSHASITALGAEQRQLNGLSQTPDRARALAEWIGTGAPDPRTLPMPLRRGL